MGSRTGAVTNTRLLFLVGLTLLAAAYTVVAFGMEWRIERGQIGPGFFPRIVGVVTVVGCLVAIARSVYGGEPASQAPRAEAETDGAAGDPAEPAAPEGGAAIHSRVTLLLVGCGIVYFFTFELLGALLSSVLFLALGLSLVNKGRHRLNAVVSILVPVGLYLLFEVLLDAGLPPGLVLPL